MVVARDPHVLKQPHYPSIAPFQTDSSIILASSNNFYTYHFLFRLFVTHRDSQTTKIVAGLFLLASIFALSQGALGLAASSGASGILSSINTISDECVKLNATLNGFIDNAQITGAALKLRGEASDLLKDIKNGADETVKVSSLEPAGQEKIADAIIPLSENVVSLISGFIAKKPVFQKAVFGGSADCLVKKDLQDLKEATDSFGQAALKSFSRAPKEKANYVLKEIDEHFADAIKTFST